MTLPFDFHRCHGQDGRTECTTCQRKTETVHGERQSWMAVHTPQGQPCSYRIPANDKEVVTLN